MYKCFTKDYRVYLFEDVRKDFSVWDMVDDVANSMKQLGIDSADFFGSFARWNDFNGMLICVACGNG